MMQNQVYGFITQTLVQMNVPSSQITKDADILFDLNLKANQIDKLFSALEKKYYLKSYLMVSEDITTLNELAYYIDIKARSTRFNFETAFFPMSYSE